MVENSAQNGKDGANGSGLGVTTFVKSILTTANVWHLITRGSEVLLKSGSYIVAIKVNGGGIYSGIFTGLFSWHNLSVNHNPEIIFNIPLIGAGHALHTTISLRTKTGTSSNGGDNVARLELSSTETLSVPIDFQFSFTLVNDLG